MATVVSLRVSGISFDEEQRIDKIEAQIPSISFIKSNGFTVAEVFIDDNEANLFHSVTDAILRLKSIDAGVKVERVDPAIVHTSDIARLAGVSRQAVSQWVQREGSTFPRELDSVGGTSQAIKIWSLYVVNEWLLSEFHLDLDLDLPSQKDVDAINAYIINPHDSVNDELQHLNSTMEHRRGFETSPSKNKQPTILFSQLESYDSAE